MEYVEYQNSDFAEFESLLNLIKMRSDNVCREESKDIAVDVLIELITSKYGKIYLAKNEQEAVGVICGYIENESENDTYGVISHIVVRRKFCGQGVGAELLRRMEEYFEKNGCVSFSADVNLTDSEESDFWRENHYCQSTASLSKQSFRNSFRRILPNDNDKIVSLKGADRVRKRPAVIFGNDNKEGCMTAFRQLIRFSIDEAIYGYGNKIIVRRYKDGSISIRDFSRGIDIGFTNPDDGLYYGMFTELFAEPYYDDLSNGSGIGMMYGEPYEKYYDRSDCALFGGIQMATEFMNVRVVRNETARCLTFERGEYKNGYEESAVGEPNGTYIHFAFDPFVFTEYTLSDADILSIIKREAVTASGVEFIYIDEKLNTESIQYAGGICERFNELSRSASPNPLIVENEFIGSDKKGGREYTAKAKIVFGLSTHGFSETYHNYRFLLCGGTHIKAIDRVCLEVLNKYISSNNELKERINNIRAYEYMRHRQLIVETYAEVSLFENGTRKSIGSKLIADNCTDMICKELGRYLSEHDDLLGKIVEHILSERKLERLTADGSVEKQIENAVMDYEFGNDAYLINLLSSLPVNDFTMSLLKRYNYIEKIKNDFFDRYADSMTEETYRDYKHFLGGEHPEVCRHMDAKFGIDNEDNRRLIEVEREKEKNAHRMKLNSEPFEKICRGKKCVELRLYDEKRKHVKVGDYIRFSMIGADRNITVKVTNLHVFPSFKELYNDFKGRSEIYKFGYSRKDNPDPNDMNQYYTPEKQAEYGVVGIEFERSGVYF